MRLPVSIACSIFVCICLLPSLFSESNSNTNTLLSNSISPSFAAAASSPHSHNKHNEQDDDEDDDEVSYRTTGRHSTGNSDESSDSPHLLSLRILHSINEDSGFTQRGEVVLNYNPPRAAGGKVLSFSTGQSLSRKSVDSLIRKLGPHALYRLKFIVNADEKQNANSEADAVTASVPICALVASHFHESFLFHASPVGQLLSVSYRTPISECSDDVNINQAFKGSEQAALHSKGKISFGRPGEKAKTHIRPGFDAASQAAAQAMGSEAPPAAAPTPQQEPQRSADGTIIKPEEPKTFWQKYWMYIVPLGLYMLLQAVLAPPEGAGGPPGAGAGRK